MRLDFRRWVASCLLVPTVALSAARMADAASIFDCFTGKKTSSTGSCKTGQCGTPGAGVPAAGVPGTTVPNGTQPYMVPIGPPRYVPAPTGQPGAPSLSPTGVSLPSSDPTTVSRPVWPASGVPQSTFYQPSTIPSTVPSTIPGAAPAAVSPVPSSVYPGSSCPTCQQTVGVNYAPYTAYKTQTINVPTTVYRPVTGIDPRTGTPVTVLQPCQVTTQQVQRVPVPLSRSFARAYRPIPVTKKPATPVVVGMPVAAAPMVVAPTYVPVVQTPAPTYSTVPAATWGTYGAAAPAGGYYVAPSAVGAYSYATPPSYAGTYPTVPATGYAAPSYTAPSYGSPSPNVPRASTVPGPTAPGSAAPGTLVLPPPPSGDPADAPPTLKSSSSGAAGASSLSGPSFRPSFPSSPTRDSQGSTPASQQGGSLQPVPADAFPLRPIPTPEAEDASPGLRDRIPSLILPADDRTAAKVTSDRMLTSRTDESPRTVRATSASQPRSVSDSGWRSVSP